MTRIASFGQTQLQLNSLLQNQARLITTQDQISTGKKAQTFSGMTNESSTLMGVKSLKSRTDKYMETLTQINQQLDMNNVQMGAIENSAQALKQAMVEAVGQNQSSALPELLQETLSSLTTALNAKIGSNYIFAGSRVDTPPVKSGLIADLLAAPDAASLFQNDSTKPSARTGDDSISEYGLLASDIGQDLMASLKRIADFNAGPNGPIEGPLTAAQRSFLQTEIGNMTSSIDTVLQQNAVNGIRSQKTEDLKSQYQNNSDFLAGFIGDIEDTDMTQAAAQLSLDQLSLQASYKVMAQMSQMSLLNFLK